MRMAGVYVYGVQWMIPAHSGKFTEVPERARYTAKRFYDILVR